MHKQAPKKLKSPLIWHEWNLVTQLVWSHRSEVSRWLFCSITVCFRDSQKTAELSTLLPAMETFLCTVLNRCCLQSKAINEAVLANRLIWLPLFFAENLQFGNYVDGLCHDNRCVYSQLSVSRSKSRKQYVCLVMACCVLYKNVICVNRGNGILNALSTPITCFCLRLVENYISQN